MDGYGQHMTDAELHAALARVGRRLHDALWDIRDTMYSLEAGGYINVPGIGRTLLRAACCYEMWRELAVAAQAREWPEADVEESVSEQWHGVRTMRDNDIEPADWLPGRQEVEP